MTKRGTSPTGPGRREKAAALRERDRKAERRRGTLIIGSAAAVSVVLLGWVTIAVMDAQREQDELADAAGGDIEGVEDFSELGRNHVEALVDYPQNPSVGGDHASVWTNCGVYSEPVDPMQTTHSLEHGAVWIGHDPALSGGQLDTLESLAERNPYVVLSPVEDMEAPVTASAWGVQLSVDSVEDPRLTTFAAKYQEGEQTPEPGAPCTGGVGEPA